MVPAKQTKVGEHGNCYAACIASILELPIDDIPDVSTLDDGAKQASVINCWLKDRFGLSLLELTLNRETGYQWPDIWYIASGPSPKHKDYRHCMVARAGELVWNPGPEDSRLQKVATVEVFVVADPAEHMKKETTP